MPSLFFIHSLPGNEFRLEQNILPVTAIFVQKEAVSIQMGLKGKSLLYLHTFIVSPFMNLQPMFLCKKLFEGDQNKKPGLHVWL